MKLLLDTHLLIWAAEGATALSAVAKTLINDPANQPIVSVVSIWEVAIKHRLARADFQIDPSTLRHLLLANGYGELPISSRHAIGVANLPPYHKDPFDRLLFSQATVEAMTLLSADPALARYPGPIHLV